MGDDWRKYFRPSFGGGFAHPDAPDSHLGSANYRLPASRDPSAHVPHPHSPAARWFDWSQLPGIDLYERARAVIEAAEVAQRHALEEVKTATGEELDGILDSIIPGLLLCLCVLAATTGIGAAAGAAIGVWAFGVGAAPGAAAGATAGFNAGLALLEWMGLAFLVGYIGKSLLEALELATEAVIGAWRSVDVPDQRTLRIQIAGKQLAKALGVLMRGVLQGVVAFLTAKGTAAVAPRVAELCAQLRASKLGAGFAAWVEARWRALIKNPKLQPEPTTVPRPNEGGVPAGESGGGGGGGGGPKPKQEPPKPKPEPEPQPKPEPKESEAARKLRERREAAKKAKLQEDIKKAEQSPKYKKLSKEDRAFLEENPRHKELAYDPDTKSFKVDEAKAALQAEKDGVVTPPMQRAIDDAGNSQGADYIDGDGKPWDVKDASGGAKTILKGAAPEDGTAPENILVDARKLSPAEQAALEQEVKPNLPPGSGEVQFVPKR